MLKRIKELKNYKELILNLTSRDLKLKYKSSALGFLWSLFNPLMMMVVYTIVFNNIFPNDTPNYPVFVLTGILAWTFFQGTMIAGTRSIIDNAQLVKKVYFPREIIPLSLTVTNFVNYLITLVVVIVAIIVTRVPIGINIIFFPIILILFFIFTYGFVLLLSSLDVYYRDIFHFIEVLFTPWMYLTPIIYSMDMFPENLIILKKLLYLNPMTLVVQSIRGSLLNSTEPLDFRLILGIAVWAIVMLILGYRTFGKLEKGFAEEI